MEFHPTGQNWITFRVAAKLPDEYHPAGTRLVAYFQFVYYKLDPSLGTMDSLFPSKEEAARRENVSHERANEDIIISAPNPVATIVFPDGTTSSVSLPFFEKPFNHKETEYPNTPWGPEVLISPKRVESFKVIFPDIYLNGKKLDIPPVEFNKANGTYGPVLNC